MYVIQKSNKYGLKQSSITKERARMWCNTKPQAYCYAELNGSAAADALFAAQQILDSISISYGNKLLNIGYSQGAQTALAALPLFNQIETKTFLGEGIYDLVSYYNEAIEKDIIEIPADIPLTLITAIECTGAHITYTQCFADSKQVQLVNDALSKQYSFLELNTRVGSNRLSDILSLQLCDTTTEEYKELASALKKMSYIPYDEIEKRNKIYLFHSTTDYIMPITQSHFLETTLNEIGIRKVYHKYADWGSHDEAILPFVKYVLIRTLM